MTTADIRRNQLRDMGITPNPTDLPRRINGRILAQGYCFGGCGQHLEQWITVGSPIICQG